MPIKTKRKPVNKVTVQESTIIKVHAYAVMQRAVEEGLRYGWSRAHKHTNKPTEDAVMECLETHVMSAICELFDFGDWP